MRIRSTEIAVTSLDIVENVLLAVEIIRPSTKAESVPTMAAETETAARVSVLR